MHNCVADTVSMFMPDPVFKSDCFINFDDVMQIAASGCIDIDMLYVMVVRVSKYGLECHQNQDVQKCRGQSL